MNRKRSALNNRILTMFGAVLVIALSLVSIRNAFVSAVALEQTARCGAVEHHHNTACYENNRLCCGQKEHTHNRNCYLVLLKDNDINSLLSYVDSDESHNLESLIYRTVGTAIQYNTDLAVVNKDINPVAENISLTNTPAKEPQTEPAVQPTQPESTTTQSPAEAVSVQDVDISQLNNTIVEQEIEPNIVLNENLYNAAAVSSGPSDTVALLAASGSSGGVSTLAVDDSPNLNSGYANFYINLDTDNNWVCIGATEFEVGSTSSWFYSTYYAYMSTADILTFINGTLDTDFTRNNLRLSWKTSSTGNSSWETVELSSDTTRFGGNYSRESSASAARYIRILDENENAIRFYTVTFRYEDGTTEKRYVQSGQQTTLPAGHTWTSGGNTYNGGQAVTITSTVTFTEPSVCTVTYQYLNGASSTDTVDAGTQITLPSGHLWASNGVAYNGGDRVTINTSTTFTEAVLCTVTYQYPDGTTSTVTAASGTQVTLPTGYTWTSNGATYNGGDRVTINGNTTFIGAIPEITIRIQYDLNFSASVAEAPTIVGGSGMQTVTSAEPATIRTVSPRDPRRLPSGWNSAAEAYYFTGWTTTAANGETVHISPGANMTAAQLAQYANESGVVQLTGNWDSGVANNTNTRSHVVTFFMGLRSEAPDYGENAGPAASPDGYTSCIYTSYMGNPPASSFYITDETPDNSYNVDKKIRSLVGEKSDQLWLSSIPTDEEVFAALKSYAQNGQLSADGEKVDPDELTSEYYAIRWYVLKYDTGGSSADNGWHIDGRLVKKEGTIRVTKTFLSDAEVLNAAQNGFYIEAFYDDPSGTTNDRSVIMHLDNGTVSTGSAEALTPVAVTGNTYEWHIKHVGVRQEWTITERIVNPSNSTALSDHTVYSEYSLFDSSGLNQSAQAEYGSEVSVTGVTQAVDESDQHMLRVDFTNYYLRKDAVALKKEDGSTGTGLPGVRFEMYHLNMDSPLKFSGVPGNYAKDDNGTITQLETDANGYISISGFSYDRDLVVFREVAPPSGYSHSPDITLQGSGSDDNLTVQIVKVGDQDASSMNQNDLDATAEFHNTEQVLVIKDYSVEETSVTVTKKWAVSEALQTDTVTVELYANGQLASNVIPGLTPVSVTLSKADGYTYTWNDLPAYVNGSEVAWSVYETAVGSEKRTVTGTFINWVDSYDLPNYTYVEGQLVNTELVVRNDARRTMLNILKTNEEGTKVLPGAQFRLVSLNNSLTTTTAYDQTLTTDENGRLTFDNLTAGYYLLSEVSPPDGYRRTMEDTRLYIDASGIVQKATLVNGSIVKTDLTGNPTFQSAFTLHVTNYLVEFHMPTTGGSGPGVSYGLGGALMLLAACGYILLKPRERGRRQSSP